MFLCLSGLVSAIASSRTRLSWFFVCFGVRARLGGIRGIGLVDRAIAVISDALACFVATEMDPVGADVASPGHRSATFWDDNCDGTDEKQYPKTMHRRYDRVSLFFGAVNGWRYGLPDCDEEAFPL